MPDLSSGTVTFVFTDVEGSARLWEEHPEATRQALARHDGLLVSRRSPSASRRRPTSSTRASRWTTCSDHRATRTRALGFVPRSLAGHNAGSDHAVDKRSGEASSMMTVALARRDLRRYSSLGVAVAEERKGSI